MINRLILILGIFYMQTTVAQQVVFTALNASADPIFWKMDILTPFVYENITDSLNIYASFPGVHKGPITTSHNGNYYIFQSTRFDNNIGGYEAITICKSDFSYFEVPKDASGNAYHSEGIMQITNDGKTIFFVQGGGTHTRDIYKITKSGTTWSAPVELTASGSNFNYYLSPYLSYDETKILFEASPNFYPITTIQKMDINGNNINTVVAITTISGASQVKSPAYDVNANIYFEAETDAERIWKIDSTGSAPFVINNNYTNDNSPITLPNGKILSLYIPNSLHEIKMMNPNGTSTMLTNSSAPFVEVEDIGISAGGYVPTAIHDNLICNINMSLYPNPNTGKFKINFASNGQYQIIITDVLGNIIQEKSFSGMTYINDSKLATGLYFVKIIERNSNMSSTRKFIVENK